MRRMMAIGLALSLGLLVSSSSAQEVQWRPAAPRPLAASPAPIPAAGVSLGRPIALDCASAAPARLRDAAITPASYSGATLAAPQPIVRGQSVDARPLPPGAPGVTDPVGAHTAHGSPVTTYSPTTVLPASPAEAYNSGVVTEPPAPPCGRGLFCCGPVCGETCSATRSLFESDHCFDEFISPMSNPFLFLDPRALTQVRPLAIYQTTPHSNHIFHGGAAEFFGLQASLALTERWSIIINRLGGVAVQPGNNSDGFTHHGGFSEVWIAPQWTFLRSEATKTLAAAGVTFQIPAGSRPVFQDTGSLSVVPYVSFAQAFGRSSWGTFDYMGTTGFSIATDSKRSEYFFLSTHLDYDIANLHKIYPLIEINYFNYTKSGNSAPADINFEGRDLVNFGGNGVAGGSSVTMALGCRYKFNEHIQTGIAAEFPLVRQRDITEFRLTADVIIRY